jgi:bifunctional DNA-binding transcriptional regulator/antitoxin component of YhaV-PrlF toxin-antitoxin module
MKTVVIRETGELVLPREILEESHIAPETELVVIARAGQILLLDLEQMRHRLEEIGQQMREALRTSLGRVGRDAVFAGLGLDAYLALSEEEEKALWDGLFQEAEQELKSREQDIPTRLHACSTKTSLEKPYEALFTRRLVGIFPLDRRPRLQWYACL